MNIHEDRSRAVPSCMEHVKSAVSGGVSISSLDAEKAALNQLALRRELFPETDFPWPKKDDGNTC